MHQCTNAPMHECTNARMQQCTTAGRMRPPASGALVHSCISEMRIRALVKSEMGTLSEQLAAHAERLVARPRIYADANVPAGLVAHMRARLHWDVLFVLEHDDLRRAPDARHYHLAKQLRRTLVTLD